ncbi:MAG: AbrB/MazE/SpoVT family DNA-binding domain-containing protein [archaeon]
MFENVCSVGERGQITLPKPVRDAKGIRPKDKVVVKIEGDRIIVEKAMGKKEKEKLIKEYYRKYSELENKIAKEWEHASKEADAMLDDY